MAEAKKKVGRKIPVLEATLRGDGMVEITTTRGDEIEVDQETFEKMAGVKFKSVYKFQLVPLKPGERKTKQTVEVTYKHEGFTVKDIDGLEDLCAGGFIQGTGIELPEKKKGEEVIEDDREITILCKVILVDK
jgi:hypothetical protein